MSGAMCDAQMDRDYGPSCDKEPGHAGVHEGGGARWDDGLAPAAPTHSAWCCQTMHARLGLDWTVRNEVASFEEAASWARAHRGDGFKARVQKWCPKCSSYRTSYLGDCCARCVAAETAVAS